MNSSIFVFLLIGCVVADITEEDGNAYVDKMLRSLKDYSDLISMPMQDRDIHLLKLPFSKEIAIEIRLRNGELKGLYNIKRINDVVVDGNSDSGTIKANLDLEAVHINYNTTFKMFKKETNFNLSAIMDNGNVILDLRVNKENNIVSINEFILEKLSGLKVHINVIGNIFQWIDNAVKSALLNSLTSDLTVIATEKLRYAFECEISKRPFEKA
ncbi:uncharacterized protein [Centruroides vittatus]|uniref:uncharacterized protein n=1 Tax=Centruroides vittatus TaxID=120091 RepID=UPI00350FA87D